MNSLLLLIGTTRSYLFADFGLIYQLTVMRLFHPVDLKHPNKWLFALVILLAVSSLFSTVTLYQSLQTVVRIILLAYLLPTYVIRFNKASKLFLLVLVGVGIWQLVFEVNRATGYHDQSTMYGMLGMSIVLSRFPFLAAAGTGILAMSIARMPMFILWIYAFMVHNKRTYYVVGFASVVFFIVGMAETPDRFSVEGIRKSIVDREEIRTEFSDEKLAATYDDGRCGERHDVELRLFGYGFGGYCYATGQPTPHNIYKLSLYELGILVVPFWLIIGGLLWRVKYEIWIPLAVLGWYTDELFATPSGIYIIGLWLLSLKVFDSMQTVRTPNKWYAG